ncbi:probable Sn1-specific diacylglycerol lipase alpha [Coccomyxa sp. Obi]|nr:probable Sn1-specific diacylglycerol lipase alpha [Coccomyxa sp. Obi]
MTPLLNVQLTLWILQLGIAIYGTWVVADVHLNGPSDACWFIYHRKTGVHYLVYFMWAHQVFNWARVLIIYNIFPTFDSMESWRRRLAALAIITRSRDALTSVEERLGTRSMREIAELYAAIIQGVDLTPTDQIDALVLLGGLQQMRRLTHVVDIFKAAVGIPAENRLPPELKSIPEIARRFNQPELKRMRSSSTSGKSSNIGNNRGNSGKQKTQQQCAESMEEGRALDADTRLPASLDTLHCLTPTGYASMVAPEMDPAEAAELYTGHHEPVSRRELHEASNFVRFAMAAYNTQAYTYQVGSYWKGMFQLLFGRRWQASRANLLNKDKVHGIKQRVAYESIVRLAQIEDTDLLYMNIRDEPLGSLPYIVALDRVSRSVVVAVRGTWSLADFVTDVIAVPKPADWWLPPSLQQKQKDGNMEGVYAHSGVLSAAATIWKDMEEHCILPVLLSRDESLDRPSGEDLERLGEGGHVRGKYAAEIARLGLKREGWKLVVVGHSLGAGVAALLSLKLLDQYPNVKCWAYCPPGGLVSPNLSAILGDFCCGIAVAKDGVPRLSLKNLDRLLDEMIVALARSNMHTLRILLGALLSSKYRRRKRLRKLFRAPDEVPAEALKFLCEFRRHSAQADPEKFRDMLPPGRMIFARRLKRLVKRKRRREKWDVTWDAVYIEPEEIVREGILVSRKLLEDHRLNHLNEALKRAEGLDPDQYTRDIQAARLPPQQEDTSLAPTDGQT